MSNQKINTKREQVNAFFNNTSNLNKRDPHIKVFTYYPPELVKCVLEGWTQDEYEKKYSVKLFGFDFNRITSTSKKDLSQVDTNDPVSNNTCKGCIVYIPVIELHNDVEEQPREQYFNSIPQCYVDAANYYNQLLRESNIERKNTTMGFDLSDELIEEKK